MYLSSSQQDSDKTLVEELFPEIQEFNKPPPSPPNTPMVDSYNPLWQDFQNSYEGLEDINLSSFDDQPPDCPADQTQKDGLDRPSLPRYSQIYGSDIDSESFEY